MRFSKETLAIAVAALGGAAFASSANAAALGTNLLVDPGFEDVILPGTGAYGSAELNSWLDGTGVGFTYATGQYDMGGPLAGGGDRYFTSNGGADFTGPGGVSQIVDLSTGDTATQIAAGTAGFDLSAFMTSYAGTDVAHIHVEFLDGGGGSLGTFDVADADNSTWTLNSVSGTIAVGTATAVISVYGDANAGGPDGYSDNTSFVVSEVPEPGSLALLGLGGLALLRRRRA